jgi:nicotinamidase-related amidase
VLLLVDVINDFDFPDGAQLFRHALPAARKLAARKRRLRERGVPAIYVNENFGRWQSDFRAQVERCQRKDARGAAIAHLLAPAEDDYSVLKPKHSGFYYSTSLAVLLTYLGARRLIFTGFAADICVLFTANDACIVTTMSSCRRIAWPPRRLRRSAWPCTRWRGFFAPTCAPRGRSE